MKISNAKMEAKLSNLLVEAGLSSDINLDTVFLMIRHVLMNQEICSLVLKSMLSTEDNSSSEIEDHVPVPSPEPVKGQKIIQKSKYQSLVEYYGLNLTSSESDDESGSKANSKNSFKSPHRRPIKKCCTLKILSLDNETSYKDSPQVKPLKTHTKACLQDDSKDSDSKQSSENLSLMANDVEKCDTPSMKFNSQNTPALVCAGNKSTSLLEHSDSLMTPVKANEVNHQVVLPHRTAKCFSSPLEEHMHQVDVNLKNAALCQKHEEIVLEASDQEKSCINVDEIVDYSVCRSIEKSEDIYIDVETVSSPASLSEAVHREGETYCTEYSHLSSQNANKEPLVSHKLFHKETNYNEIVRHQAYSPPSDMVVSVGQHIHNSRHSLTVSTETYPYLISVVDNGMVQECLSRDENESKSNGINDEVNHDCLSSEELESEHNNPHFPERMELYEHISPVNLSMKENKTDYTTHLASIASPCEDGTYDSNPELPMFNNSIRRSYENRIDFEKPTEQIAMLNNVSCPIFETISSDVGEPPINENAIKSNTTAIEAVFVDKATCNKTLKDEMPKNSNFVDIAMLSEDEADLEFPVHDEMPECTHPASEQITSCDETYSPICIPNLQPKGCEHPVHLKIFHKGNSVWESSNSPLAFKRSLSPEKPLGESNQMQTSKDQHSKAVEESEHSENNALESSAAKKTRKATAKAVTRKSTKRKAKDEAKSYVPKAVNHQAEWTREEDRKLLMACQKLGSSFNVFCVVAKDLSNRKVKEVKSRFNYLMELYKKAKSPKE